MNDFKRIRAGEGYRALSVDDVITRNHKTYAWLASELDKDFQGKTLVVTHHCPLVDLSGPEKDSVLMPAYSNDWLDLVRKSDFWVFGHTHSRVDVMVDNCRVVSNPRGYPNEDCGFDPDFSIEIN